MRLLNDLRNERILTANDRSIDAVVRVRGVDLSSGGFGLVIASQEPVALLVHEGGAMTRQSLPSGGIGRGIQFALFAAPLVALIARRMAIGGRT